MGSMENQPPRTGNDGTPHEEEPLRGGYDRGMAGPVPWFSEFIEKPEMRFADFGFRVCRDETQVAQAPVASPAVPAPPAPAPVAK